MCLMCAAFSTMTLFSPVTEAPQPVGVNPISVPNAQTSQVIKSVPMAEETRISIAKFLQQVPNSPETRILREEFKSMQTKLVGVKDDAKAGAIINGGLNTLSERVTAAPNSEQITEVMNEMLVDEGNP